MATGIPHCVCAASHFCGGKNFPSLRLRVLLPLEIPSAPARRLISMVTIMAGVEESGNDGYTVFAGSAEHDVMCSKIFWNSVTLQPPLESRLVSGDLEQRRREAGQRRNYPQQELEDLKTEYFLLEAQREQDVEQRSIYMEKAKRREEIIALLKKQREDRVKKELVSFGHKPNIQVDERWLPTPDIEEVEDIKAVRQLE